LKSAGPSRNVADSMTADAKNIFLAALRGTTRLHG
jgi:hypothetical protein